MILDRIYGIYNINWSRFFSADGSDTNGHVCLNLNVVIIIYGECRLTNVSKKVVHINRFQKSR